MQEKSDRKEDPELTWELLPGMILRCCIWKDSMQGSKDLTKVKPKLWEAWESMDVIPPFTVMEIEIAIKGWSPYKEGDTFTTDDGSTRDRPISPVRKGYGIALNGMVPSKGTFYSCIQKCRKVLPANHTECNAIQQDYIKRFPSIAQVIQGNQASFIINDLSTETYIDVDEENKLLKLSQWSPAGDENAIDISYDNAIKYTNCRTMESAATLLELACKAGCLSVVAMYNRFRVNPKVGGCLYVL